MWNNAAIRSMWCYSSSTQNGSLFYGMQLIIKQNAEKYSVAAGTELDDESPTKLREDAEAAFAAFLGSKYMEEVAIRFGSK